MSEDASNIEPRGGVSSDADPQNPGGGTQLDGGVSSDQPDGGVSSDDPQGDGSGDPETEN